MPQKLARRTVLLSLLLACSLLLVAAGCGEGAPDEEEPASSGLAPEGFDVPASEQDGPAPAWQTEAEKQRGKEDRLDIRGSHQDIYGVTAPPAGPARAVAEFEPHDGVLIAWADYMEPFMADLVDAIDDASDVYIVTHSLGESRQVRDLLRADGVDTSKVFFFEYPHDSLWTRDYGPIPVALEDGEPAFVDAAYYSERRRDDATPTLMSSYFDVQSFRPDLATEGGNFMTNGEGLCVATEWLAEENPHLSRAEIQDIKRDYFGCTRTVILERMDREGTGHVDMFAKFVAPDTVLVGDYDEQVDPANAAILDRNAQTLASLTLADGSPLQVERIPMPAAQGPIFRSYTNSLIINDTVVVPVYPSDRAYEDTALRTYREVLGSDYQVITVDSDAIIELGGAVHCTTMGFALEPLAPAADLDPPDDPDDPDAPQDPPADTFSSAPDAAILDMEQTEDTIVIDDDTGFESVIVTVDIDHTYVGDLIVWLERDGEQIVLHQNTGGSADSLRQSWRIDDLDGTSRAGQWTLVVEDTARYDEGVLSRWKLTFE
jgi:agmatine deiminase